jgi:hypothetical protein
MKLDNEAGVKHKGAAKTARIPIKIVPLDEKLKKPDGFAPSCPPASVFMKSNRFCAIRNCIPCAKKPPARISASASAKARPPS